MNKPAILQRLKGDPPEIEALARKREGPCVSLYLPIFHAPPESDQNPVRLREWIEEAADQLGAQGVNAEDTKKLLQPLSSLVTSPEKLLSRGKAFAFFTDADSAHSIELPYRAAFVCRVGNRFSIKPLLPLLQWNPTYTAVCLNRGEVRAFRGNRSGIEAIDVPDMPGTLEEVTAIDDPEKSLQQHTSKTESAKGRPGSVQVSQQHGQGLPSDLEDSQLDRFFRNVSKALQAELSGKEDALILFGVEENLGLLTSMNEWKERLVITKTKDPHSWSIDRIRQEACELLEPQAKVEMDSRLDQFNEAKNKGTGLFDLRKCALAAATGRIEKVVVAQDVEIEGTCDLEKMEVKLNTETALPDSDDLYNFIASETIRYGGEAFTVEAANIPGEDGVAATLRV